MSEYTSNTEPKVGDKVKLSRDDDRVYVVVGVMGGRFGNKVTIQPIGRKDGWQEYYYYCLTKID